MPSPKRWLQPSSDGGQNGGAGNGAAESLGERAVLEEVMPGAEEHLEEALVAEDPNVGMNPNVDMVSNAEAEGRAVSVSPKPGEKRNWDATGGIDREMEVTVLRVLQKHGYQPSTSTSGRMVDQGSQTDLIGEVLQAARRPLNKIKGDPSASSLGGGSGYEQKGAESFEAAPTAEYAMGEEEILQMEAERLRQLSEEEDEMRQVSERDGFRKDEHLIKACDGTTWEWHFHEDGRQYFYCLDTQESKWTLPVVGEKMKSDEVVGSPSGNELEMEAALGSSSSTPTPESTRAFQGSVNSVGEKDFSSTIRDSGPRAGGDAPTSGSPDEEGIPGNRADIAGAQHLDREEMEALSEGVAAVESVGPEEKMPNVEIGTVSAAEERVVDVVPVVQEGGPGDLEDGGKKLCVTTEEVSSFGAKNPAIQGEKEASGIAGDTEDLKDEAWSANDAGSMCQIVPGVRRKHGLRRIWCHVPRATATMGRRSPQQLMTEVHRWTHWCNLKLAARNEMARATPEPMRQLWSMMVAILLWKPWNQRSLRWKKMYLPQMSNSIALQWKKICLLQKA